MAETRRLNQLVSEALIRAQFPKTSMRVALSGGADSAALALLASKTGSDVDAIHVNHGFDASSRLEGAARAVADHLGLDLETVTVEVAAGPSPEARAREARYRALTESDSAVVTGHTSDDQAETVLINLIRGTGLTGLAGIPYHRPPNIWRPLLEVSRAETREIAALAALPFFDDPMNLDQEITRNRVRARLLPVLREFNPNIVSTLNQMAGTLARDVQALDGVTPHRVEGDSLAASVLLTLPRAIADRVLIGWLRMHEVEVSGDLLRRVWRVVAGESVKEDLLGGAAVVRSGALVQVERVG